jgi:transcriptional regulator with XRE-family HTH domain
VSQDRHRNRTMHLPYLREQRQRRGLSQKELGELARVSPGTVYRVENGLRGAYPGTVRKLATALEVAPKSCMGRTPDAKGQGIDG